MKSRYIAYFLLLLVAVSCEPKLDDFKPSAGSADFSKYISLGNSLTAGYADGALYLTSQTYSYPNMIAQQMKLAGGGEFKQPLMFDELGFGGKRILKLNPTLDCSGNPVAGAPPSWGTVLAEGTPDARNILSIAIDGPYNNLGVPGAKSFHLLAPTYGNLNPYFKRFASNPQTTSVLAQAMEMDATFFSLWIGNNDVLWYAMEGGAADNITSQDAFSGAYLTLLDGLTANGAKGLVASIPNVTSVPFFTTVPYNGLDLTEQQAEQLNQAYSAVNDISFTRGNNPWVISDPFSQNGLGMRQIKPNELVLLTVPQDSLKCFGWGTMVPIPGKYILDESEIAAITIAVDNYNLTIKSLAEAKGLAFADANLFMKTAKSGLVYDGLRFSPTFVTGGVFSLDGIHLSPRGNAIIANFFIDAINEHYNANVPHVNISDYPGILFP